MQFVEVLSRLLSDYENDADSYFKAAESVIMGPASSVSSYVC